MFGELYKNDNQMITPSEELLAQISEMVKNETDNPKPFWLRTRPFSHFAAIAAGVIIIVAAASAPIIISNFNNTKSAAGGSGFQLQNEEETIQIKSFALPEAADGREIEIVEDEAEFAKDSAADVFFIEEEDVEEEDVVIDETFPARAYTDGVSEEYAVEDDIYIADDEIYDIVDEYDEGSVTGGAVNTVAYEMNPDFLSYTEWASADVWDTLVTSDNEPTELIIPENDGDIYDSPVNIDTSIGNFSVFEDFVHEFLSGQQEITMFACPNRFGVYPAAPFEFYGIYDRNDFYAPIFSMLVKNLSEKITYSPEQIIDLYIAHPYHYGTAVIKIGVMTEKSFIAFFIDDTDRLVIENSYHNGMYELRLEEGTYRKLWNYINYYGSSIDDVTGGGD